MDYPVDDGVPAQKKTIIYDPNGNKFMETDENGHTTTYGYDGLNRLTSVSRAMAASPSLQTTYSYNAVNSRISVTDARGYTTQFGYDALQRLILQTDAFNALTTYEYGANAGGSVFASSSFKPTRVVTDGGRHAEDTEYDELYRPTKVTRSWAPSSVTETPSITSLIYDNVGNVLFSTDAAGKMTETNYDALNRAVRANFAAGTFTRTLYTSTGLKWKTYDELAQATEMQYDGAGRLTQTYGPPPDPAGHPTVRPLTRTIYDPNGNIQATIDARLNEWDYVFDKRNRKIEEDQPTVADFDSGTNQRPILKWEYDGVGNVIASTDARNNRTETSYDWANRPTQVKASSVPAIQPDGSSVWVRPTAITEYDLNGNVLTVTDPNNHQTINTYDALNHLHTTTRSTDAGTETVTYGYDAVGNRTSVQDGNLHTTTFDYDGLHRNVKITDALGQATIYTYDGLNKVSRLDANNHLTLYDQYDARNRLKHVHYPASTQEDCTYSYDNAGHLLSVMDDNGNSSTAVAYTYDGLGRVATETSNGATHSYGYDLAGNRTTAQYGVIGGGNGRSIVSTYDVLNRLSTLVEGGNTTTYHYDLAGHVRGKDLASGEHEVTGYDALGRQTDSADTAAGGGTLYVYDYGHDAGGNLRRMGEYKPGLVSSTRTTTMVYDASDRLTQETVYNGTSTDGTSLVSDTAYGYDLAGNRVSKNITGGKATTYSPNDLNQLTGLSESTGRSVSFTYDANGNRATRTEGSAADVYSYDAENRLTSLDKSGTHYAYLYDYRTRRVNRTEGSMSTPVVYSGGTSVQEYVDNGGALVPSVEFIRGSDWGGGVGGILYSLRGGITSFDHFDGRGDVATQTNGAGTVTYQAEYEAWGTRTQEFGNDQDRQRANTKEEDPTGLLDEGMRYRDLETGSFITRDPAGMVDGPNLYAYVTENPWSKFDPEGLSGTGEPDGIELFKNIGIGLAYVVDTSANFVMAIGTAGNRTDADIMSPVNRFIVKYPGGDAWSNAWRRGFAEGTFGVGMALDGAVRAPEVEAPKEPARGSGQIGDVGTMRDLKKPAAGTGLERHEIPSRAAQEKAFIDDFTNQNGRRPTASEVNAAMGNNPAVLIPPDTHAQTDTYKSLFRNETGFGGRIEVFV